MIQRIQTVYYLIALIALIVPMFGMDIFSFSSADMVQHVSMFGSELKELKAGSKQLLLPDWPLFWGNVLVLVFLFLTIFSYKRLKMQLALGRATIFLYVAVLVGLLLLGYFYSQWLLIYRSSLSLGIGMYIQLIGLVFVWLGNRGVRKDRKLLDSLNRLR